MSGANEDNSGARLAAIVASSDDAIISKDLNGVIQTWNRGAERIFGYTPEEVVGRSITIIIPADRLPEEDEVLRRIRAGESVDHFETVRRAKDGRFIDISLTVSPILDSAGRIIGASKIARDITEQRRLQREAAEASRLKDEFLATLSHELRTPLNAILGYATLLGDRAFHADQHAKAADVIRRNAETLARLVDDLLDTSRIVTGKLHLQMAPCDVPTLIRDSLDVVRQAIDAKRLRVDLSMNQTETILADGDRLRQVFWNLLTNAIKFTPEGGTISVRVQRIDGRVTIRVRDTGIGIPAASLPLVFQRFWQLESTATREHGGLGLGLALSRYLVELHGGQITVQSAGPDKGAEFTVELPAPSEAGRPSAAPVDLAMKPTLDGRLDTDAPGAADIRVRPRDVDRLTARDQPTIAE